MITVFLLIFLATKITPNEAHAIVDMNGNLVFPDLGFPDAKKTPIQWQQEVLHRGLEEANHDSWTAEKDLNFVNPLIPAEVDENIGYEDWWKYFELQCRKEMRQKAEKKGKQIFKEHHSKREVSPKVFNQHLLQMWMQNLSPHNQE